MAPSKPCCGPERCFVIKAVYGIEPCFVIKTVCGPVARCRRAFEPVSRRFPVKEMDARLKSIGGEQRTMTDRGDHATEGRRFERRRLLGALTATASAGLAGCLVATPRESCPEHHPPPNGFRIRNGDTQPRAVTVEVIQDRIVTGATVYTERFELDASYENGTVNVADVLTYAGRYVARAWTDERPDAVNEQLWFARPDTCNSLDLRINGGVVSFDVPDAPGIV